MGFFDGLGRFMRGEPVFKDEDHKANVSQNSDHQAVDMTTQNLRQTSVDTHGYKIIPQIELSHFHVSRSGDRMTLEAWIANSSDEIIRIDSAEIGGQKQVFNRQLAAREGHQVTLYNGAIRHDDHDHHARIVYRLVRSDDLFEEEYSVTYTRESDGVYVLDELHKDGPTRDI